MLNIIIMAKKAKIASATDRTNSDVTSKTFIIINYKFQPSQVFDSKKIVDKTSILIIGHPFAGYLILLCSIGLKKCL